MGNFVDNLNHAAARKEAGVAERARMTQEQLLEELITETRRTNQLLEWVGGMLGQQAGAQARQ